MTAERRFGPLTSTRGFVSRRLRHLPSSSVGPRGRLALTLTWAPAEAKDVGVQPTRVNRRKTALMSPDDAHRSRPESHGWKIAVRQSLNGEPWMARYRTIGEHLVRQTFA